MTEPIKEAMEIWGRAVGAHEMAKFRMSDIPDIAAALVIQEALAERDGRIAELEAEARRFADCYPVGSDGRNTFIIFADKIKALKGRTDD